MFRGIIMLPILTIAAIAPALAQDRVSEQEARSAVEKNLSTWNAAVAKKDAATVAGLYTENAIRVTPDGPIYGRAAIEKNYADGLKPFTELMVNYDKVQVLDSGALLVSGMWKGTIQGDKGPVAMKGYWGNTLVRDGGGWKASLDVYNINMPPP